jgi:F-type H+-transporting ATPase subunit epsilon
MAMHLTVLLPRQVYVDETVTRISGEAANGSFTLLPRHIDFVTALVPGLLTFIDEEGEESFLATDRGILVKRGPEVRLSTRRAARGTDLETLRHIAEEEFRTVDEQEREARAVMLSLETDLVRRFIELGSRRV